MNNKNISVAIYSATIAIGIISSIFSFVFLKYSNMGIMGIIYGISIVALYFGGHYVLQIDKSDLTKICSPLLIPIFLALIFGYTIDSLDFIVLAMKFVPICITISLLLLEKYLFDTH